MWIEDISTKNTDIIIVGTGALSALKPIGVIILNNPPVKYWEIITVYVSILLRIELIPMFCFI